MPGQIKSKAMFRMLEARAHANPRKERLHEGTGKGPSKDIATKMLKDNPVDFHSLPNRVKKT